MTTPAAVTSEGILQAYYRLKPYIPKTSLLLSPTLSNRLGFNVFLKNEHMSMTGSYKERGALNKLLSLTQEQSRNGVICSSAGNHAQAVSYHSTRMGINSIIVMPETTPYVKVKKTADFGGKVVLHGESFSQAYEKAMEIAQEENRAFVHAFDDPKIVEGQGTVALELMEQNPFLDAVVVPVGGGGLIAGMSVALKNLNPRIKMYGVESTAMPGMHTSLQQGQVTTVPKTRSLADGIAVETIGKVPFEAARDLIDECVLVDEGEIASAILHILENEKTVVEASGATGIAALDTRKLPIKSGQNVAVVLTGGNIDMTVLGRIIERGLVKDGRIIRFRVTITDLPGGLAGLTALLADCRANIRDVVHERAFMPFDFKGVNYTDNVITLETRGPEHIETIFTRLREAGYEFATV